LTIIIMIIITFTGLKLVVSFSARDTVRPVREIHSRTPIWPGADYALPTGVGATRLHGWARDEATRPP
jgi:hypothetical protein